MTAVARIRVDDDGVRLVEIVVAAENAVASAVSAVKAEQAISDV